MIRRTPEKNIKIFESDRQDPFLAYLDGGSVVANQADRGSEILFELCKEIRETFYHVFAVGYLTPANSQTVPVHNDDQDVFIFQVWGEKHWTLHEAPQMLIFTEEMLGKSKPIKESLIEKASMTLMPGDVLYLPRGMPHEARTTSTSSFHVTITIPTSDFTIWSVLGEYMEHLVKGGKLTDNVSCRRSLLSSSALGLPSDARAVQETLLGNLVEELAGKCTLDAMENHFRTRIGRINAEQETTHAKRMKEIPTCKVCCASKVQLARGIKCECAPGANEVVFRHGPSTLTLPINPSTSELMCALSAQPQPIVDLPCKDSLERLAVCRVLLEKKCIEVS
eukprot:GEMP01018490.1.p1 GENE.GEMP01018490.1~~GEMP01018490.1.p1  ORF type:complete len:396 (+),score=60.78 GEMP01018490.1:179-1189(+)